MNYGITALEKGEEVYYSIQWSPLALADRWEINRKVPSVGGIYEIYWMDETKHLRMMAVGETNYGGLRSELRRLTDPELTLNPKTREILENKEIWYRYAPSNSTTVMSDIIWYFRKSYLPDSPDLDYKGKYKKIFIKESEPNKLIWVP